MVKHHMPSRLHFMFLAPTRLFLGCFVGAHYKGLIRRSYTFLDPLSFKRLFVALVRPHLEYCNSVCYPRFIGDLKQIESVLRRGSKLVPGMFNLTYENRLKELNLPSMLYRLKRGDMIETYKWFNKKYLCDYSPFPITTRSITRGHNFKLKKQACRLDVRKYFFSLRVVDNWNSLPNEVVCSPSLNTFKNRLDAFWQTQFYVHA